MSNGDAELRAIEQLLSVLKPIDRDAQGRAIGYVLQRLGLAVPASQAVSDLAAKGIIIINTTPAELAERVRDALSDLAARGIIIVNAMPAGTT